MAKKNSNNPIIKDKKLPEKPIEEIQDKPTECQHVKILGCNESMSRVICECWHCKQGLLIQCERSPVTEKLEAICPNCDKPAIKLITGVVRSIIPIPSPWVGDEGQNRSTIEYRVYATSRI